MLYSRKAVLGSNPNLSANLSATSGSDPMVQATQVRGTLMSKGCDNADVLHAGESQHWVTHVDRIQRSGATALVQVEAVDREMQCHRFHVRARARGLRIWTDQVAAVSVSQQQVWPAANPWRTVLYKRISSSRYTPVCEWMPCTADSATSFAASAVSAFTDSSKPSSVTRAGGMGSALARATTLA